MLIEVTSPEGRKRAVMIDRILTIDEAATSSQWHGIQSYIHLSGSGTIECRETVAEVAALVRAAASQHGGTP